MKWQRLIEWLREYGHNIDSEDILYIVEYVQGGYTGEAYSEVHLRLRDGTSISIDCDLTYSYCSEWV